MSDSVVAAPTLQVGAEETEDYEAAFQQLMAEASRLNELMQSDRAEIDHLRAETERLRAETGALRDETRAILSGMGVRL